MHQLPFSIAAWVDLRDTQRPILIWDISYLPTLPLNEDQDNESFRGIARYNLEPRLSAGEKASQIVEML